MDFWEGVGCEKVRCGGRRLFHDGYVTTVAYYSGDKAYPRQAVGPQIPAVFLSSVLGEIILLVDLSGTDRKRSSTSARGR
jgi:hypothetical protein